MDRQDSSEVSARHSKVGDLRPDLGEGIRSTYVGSYVIYFREMESHVDILRVLRGDLDPLMPR
jgi:toxin ParE1/3/4